MMRFSKYLLFFLVAFALLESCKKYPDGPWISLRSKKARIQGEWFIENYFVDNVDSTSLYNPISSGTSFSYNFQAGSELRFNSTPVSGIWDFDNHKRDIVIGVTYRNTNFPNIFILPVGNANNWKVLRLTMKNFWLQSSINGKTYEVHFKK